MGLETIALIRDERIINELSDHIRVNESTRTVEIYDEYGVKIVLRNLSEESYNAFASAFRKF